MDDILLLKVAITILGLVVFGILLTMYEFREHYKKKRASKKAKL